ncbi:MAG TPA: hypothetical protein DDX09_01550 [Hyphomonas atlantica]|nr:hypothetical protein [Hyphomonas atlantica]
MKKIIGFIPHVIAVFAAAVFLDSLRYKFTDAPETQEIFGRLDGWAGTLGLGGLFSETGLFSQYTIGTAELFASALLLIGIIPALRRLQALGALIALAVMSGAVSFHLFTPLGIDPNNDGGGLFAMAVTVWLASIAYLVFHRKTLISIVTGIGRAILPGISTGSDTA